MPQLENGYLRIANEAFDALIKAKIPGVELRVALFVIRKTWGFNKKSDWISNSQFVEGTGLNKSNICRAIRGLLVKKIVVKDDNPRRPKYCFNKKYWEWEIQERKTHNKGGPKNLKGRLSIEDIKRFIRFIDNNTCLNCGFSGEENNENLPVHHIDFNQTNNDFDNLITLCQSCHGQSHKTEAIQKLNSVLLSKRTTKEMLSKRFSEFVKDDNSGENVCQEKTVVTHDNQNEPSSCSDEQSGDPEKLSPMTTGKNQVLSPATNTKNNSLQKTRPTKKQLFQKMKKLSAIAAGNMNQSLIGDYAFIGESFDEMKVRAGRELEEVKRQIQDYDQNSGGVNG